MTEIAGATLQFSPYARRLPIYDLLVSQLTQKAESGTVSVGPEYTARLSAVLSSLAPNQAEQVALLLIHYYFLTNPSGTNPFVQRSTTKGSRLPYGIKMSPGKGFSFDPASLSPSFQALLGTYCSL